MVMTYLFDAEQVSPASKTTYLLLYHFNRHPCYKILYETIVSKKQEAVVEGFDDFAN